MDSSLDTAESSLVLNSIPDAGTVGVLAATEQKLKALLLKDLAPVVDVVDIQFSFLRLEILNLLLYTLEGLVELNGNSGVPYGEVIEPVNEICSADCGGELIALFEDLYFLTFLSESGTFELALQAISGRSSSLLLSILIFLLKTEV